MQITAPQRRQKEKTESSLEAAGKHWREILGTDQIQWAESAANNYCPNTIAVKRSIPAALRPVSSRQIAPIIQIAALHKIPIYPISTGKNWGYGSACPVRNDCVILDLSQLNKITGFDKDLGLITVQPGVTQRILDEFLTKNKLPYMVPTTGAGPDASLLGNALERGYGLTPHTDHFAAVTAIKAILPNGELYQSALAEAGGADVDKAFKWGLGPYADGLFTQGNFGVVTEATIELAIKPERVEGFFFSLKSEETLEDAVLTVRTILKQFNSVVGSINIMNARRMLAMAAPYPKLLINSDGILPDSVVEAMARRRRFSTWTGAGAIYGPTKLVKVVRKSVKAALKPLVKEIFFLTPNQAALAKNTFQKFPLLRKSKINSALEVLEIGLQNMAGRPSDIALPLAYWKQNNRPQNGKRMDPAKDGCGLLWYAPLIPMKSADVRSYVTQVEEICREHGMEPLITLTSVSSQCFDSTVPLLFNPKDKNETNRAHACLDALYEAGKNLGFLPYRAGIHSMKKMVDPNHTFWKFTQKLKKAIDPENIIAPGRYGI